MEVYSIKINNFNHKEYCITEDVEVHVGNTYIIDTMFGEDYGKVVAGPFDIKNLKKKDIAKIKRIANQEDFKKIAELETKNEDAYKIAREKVKKHNLPMKLFSAHYMFDEKRVIFYFTAENRIDFRELVKDLASVFKIRIELRQVPQREETKMLGGLGLCNREFCCTSFLKKLDKATIKMAKNQNLSLNMSKITGPCGKLLCCLEYENDTYLELKKDFPKEGTKVKIHPSNIPQDKIVGYNLPLNEEITGKVKGANVIKRTVLVELENKHVLEIDLKAIKKAGVLNVIKQ